MIFNYFVAKKIRHAIKENKVNELIDGHSFIEKILVDLNAIP